MLRSCSLTWPLLNFMMIELIWAIIFCCILSWPGSENQVGCRQNRPVLWTFWLCQEDCEIWRHGSFLQRLYSQFIRHHTLCRYRSRCVWGEFAAIFWTWKCSQIVLIVWNLTLYKEVHIYQGTICDKSRFKGVLLDLFKYLEYKTSYTCGKFCIR